MLADRINPLARRVPTWVVYLGGLIPLAFVVTQALTGDLGADPVKTLERTLGLYALQFLIATLCITPLRRFTGVMLIRFRRALGLLTFLYAVLHLTVWVTLDLAFRWGEIWGDIVKRPYIIVGMIALLLMVPLAITSNNTSVRRLGGQMWQRLHKLTYVAVALGGLHFVMQSKVWHLELVLYTAGIILLLALRLVPAAKRRVAAA
jgi:methionine sulfoxide reductase heme-binding subunit